MQHYRDEVIIRFVPRLRKHHRSHCGGAFFMELLEQLSLEPICHPPTEYFHPERSEGTAIECSERFRLLHSLVPSLRNTQVTSRYVWYFPHFL